MNQFGKFSSAEQLLKSYENLEKSFTQKCQQLADLQKQAVASGAQKVVNQSTPSQAAEQNEHNNFEQNTHSTCDTCGTNAEASPHAEEQSTTVDSATTVPEVLPDASETSGGQSSFDKISDEQLQQFVEDNPDVVFRILQKRSMEFAPDVMNGGGSVSLALPSRPKTIREASIMAKELFNQ